MHERRTKFMEHLIVFFSTREESSSRFFFRSGSINNTASKKHLQTVSYFWRSSHADNMSNQSLTTTIHKSTDFEFRAYYGNSKMECSNVIPRVQTNNFTCIDAANSAFASGAATALESLTTFLSISALCILLANAPCL